MKQRLHFLFNSRRARGELIHGKRFSQLYAQIKKVFMKNVSFFAAFVLQSKAENSALSWMENFKL